MQCNLPKDLLDAFKRIYLELNLDNRTDFDRFADLAVIETNFHLKYGCSHCKVKE